MTRRPRVRRRLAAASLRVRVMTAAAMLVAITSALTGFLGTTLLRGYLIGRDDQQLTSFANVFSTRMFGTMSNFPQRALCSRQPQLPSDFRVILIGARLPCPSFDPAAGSAMPPTWVTRLPIGTRPVTVNGPGHSWLILVRPLTAGKRVVVAFSIDDVNNTVVRLGMIDGLAGVASLAVLAVAGLFLIRASLAPLTRIEETAEAIAAGNLSERIDHPPARTEVGRLAVALNAMLGEIEAAYQARAEGEAHAKDSEDRMRQFVADASHELRTPLTAVRGLAEFGLQQGHMADRAELTRLLVTIQNEAKRMGLLVEDLLLLAQLDADRPLDPQPVDLDSIAAEAVHAARAVQPDRPVLLHTGPDPVIVVADGARIRQVIDNLLGNALRHTPALTPVTVHVTSTARDADLVVADSGPGMSADQAARVFERFYRTDSARSRASGGTGLGLSITKALVAAHNGTIALDTSPGRGTSFRVRLPLGVSLDPGSGNC